MAGTPRTTTRVVYQIKVTLKGSKPPIWRRMQITNDTTLVQLHRILQRVMGWEGSHLYQFVIAVGRTKAAEFAALKSPANCAVPSDSQPVAMRLLEKSIDTVPAGRQHQHAPS